MGTGVGDVNTDVLMLVIAQEPTVVGRCVFADGSGLNSDFQTYVLCPISEEVEEYEGQQEDSGNEVYDRQTAQAFCKRRGKDRSGKASGRIWTRGTVCACARRPPSWYPPFSNFVEV